jgi:predicted membrane protein
MRLKMFGVTFWASLKMNLHELISIFLIKVHLVWRKKALSLRIIIFLSLKSVFHSFKRKSLWKLLYISSVTFWWFKSNLNDRKIIGIFNAVYLSIQFLFMLHRLNIKWNLYKTVTVYESTFEAHQDLNSAHMTINICISQIMSNYLSLIVYTGLPQLTCQLITISRSQYNHMSTP